MPCHAMPCVTANRRTLLETFSEPCRSQWLPSGDKTDIHVVYPPHALQQPNHDDCGVFSCIHALAFARSFSDTFRRVTSEEQWDSSYMTAYLQVRAWVGACICTLTPQVNPVESAADVYCWVGVHICVLWLWLCVPWRNPDRNCRSQHGVSPPGCNNTSHATGRSRARCVGAIVCGRKVSKVHAVRVAAMHTGH